LHVPDGDSVVLKDGLRTPRVWLLGVAEPATKQQKGCALLRARFLRSLLEGQAVRVGYEPGREPGGGGPIRVHLYRASDGLWVNLEMICRGYGVPSNDCPPRLRARFVEEESKARRGRLGVWSPQTLGGAQAEYDGEEVQRWARIGERIKEREARREEFLRTHERCPACGHWRNILDRRCEYCARKERDREAREREQDRREK
jgi:endonuclease YncB( thermonuclease family)